MTTQEQKKIWRSQLRTRVIVVTPEQQEALRNRLRDWLSQQSGIWGGFSAIASEPDLTALWPATSHLDWVFPRIVGNELQFCRPRQGWVRGPFGISEPGPGAESVEPAEIQGLLVPGLGFDHAGRRLGRGKGYYDRLLTQTNAKTVGVCFEAQRVPELPVESHDRPVDWVVTEAGLWATPGR